jgi:hypothetical protein
MLFVAEILVLSLARVRQQTAGTQGPSWMTNVLVSDFRQPMVSSRSGTIEQPERQ